MHSIHHHSIGGGGGSCCGWWWSWMKLSLGAGALLVALLLVAERVGSRKVRYHARMTLYYASILLSGFLAMFGAIPTWFYGMGAMVAWTCLRWICSVWLDVRVEVRGAEKVNSPVNRSRPQVLISNHQSSLDLLAMSQICAWHCCVMVKQSLAFIPFFNIAAFLVSSLRRVVRVAQWLYGEGWMSFQSNSIFINRHDKEGAQRAVGHAASTMLKNRLKLWVFPEGTRNHEHGMLPFKKGAFNIAVSAQVPIVPVVISELAPFYSKTQQYFRPQGLIIVELLDEVDTTGLGLDDVVTLSERVREKMLKAYERISNEARERMEEGRAAADTHEDKKQK